MATLVLPDAGPVFKPYRLPQPLHGVRWSRSRRGWLLSGGAFGYGLAIGWMR